MADHLFSSWVVFLILALSLMAGIQPVLAEELSVGDNAFSSGNISLSTADLDPAVLNEESADSGTELETETQNSDNNEGVTVSDTTGIKTWYVDATAPAGGDGSKDKPYQQIQTALDACNASEENTVLVAYAGGAQYDNFTVTVPGVNISSESEISGEYPLISNPNGTGAVILADSVTLGRLNISGCTNTDDYSEILGGAVFVSDCRYAMISGCKICDNTASVGGGIAVINGSVAVIGSELSENFGEEGGSLFSLNSILMIHESRIHDNMGIIGGGGFIYESESYIGSSEIYNNIGMIGGGFVSQENDMEILNCSFSKNDGFLGGGFVSADDNVIISDSTFCDNYALNGGGIYCILSALTLQDSQLINNSASEGGAYYGMRNTETITGCEISGNSAGAGAGILTAEGKTSVTGTNILNNYIITGGNGADEANLQLMEEKGLMYPKSLPDSLSGMISGINPDLNINDFESMQDLSLNLTLSYGAGILVADSDDFIIEDNIIESNAPGINCTFDLAGSGVALLNSAGSVSGNTISGNDAVIGAGIFCMNSSAKISGNTIENNNATVAGGGYLGVGGDTTIKFNDFLENSAGDGGAGICQVITGNAFEISNNTILANKAGTNSSLISGGGGILVIGEDIIAGEFTDDKEITEALTSPDSLLFTSEIPDMISVYETDMVSGEEILKESLTWDSDFLSGNAPVSLRSKVLSPDLIADSVDADVASPVIIQGNEISQNSADSFGGGLFLLGTEAEIYYNEIENNTALLGGGAGSFLSDSDYIYNEISGNNATLGGGLSFIASKNYVRSSDISNNRGTLYGGGVSSVAGITVLYGSSVSDNIAGLGGGGFNTLSYNSTADSFFMYNVVFTGNSALGSDNFSGGGAVNKILAGNIATDLPEVINMPGLSPEIFSEIPEGNPVSRSDYSYIDYSDIINNTAVKSGGGLHIINSEYDNLYYFELYRCNISENTAYESGGGISLVSAEYNYILGCNISENTAYESGGGISLVSADYNYIASSKIMDNSAPGGDGVYFRDSANISTYDNMLINEENFRAETTETSPFEWNIFFNYTEYKTYTVTRSPYLGGNVWGAPNGTGLSQTCTDADLDGICDSDRCTIYDNDGTVVGTDERPLYYNPDYGTLIVYSVPEGADVHVNGNSYGRKSSAGYYMPPEESTVELFLENYFDSPVYTAEVKTYDSVSIRHVFTDVPEFISTGSGSSPLDFVANATGTSASLKSWKWHITSPDGVISSYDGKNVRAVFDTPGSYNVTLDAIWNNGDTKTSLPKRILVTAPPPDPVAAENASVKINGTETEILPDGSQKITINGTLSGNVTTTGSSIIVEKADGTKVVFNTNGAPAISGGNVTGQISSVTMQQPALNAAFNGSLGNASVGVSMTMNSYNEDAGLTTEISEGCADDARNAFSVACPGLKEVAYTVYFTKSGFDKDSSVTGAVLDFSVNTTWVDSMGGPDKITIVRWKDDGTSEQIKPQYLGILGTESLFRAVTDGFSVYGVAGFTPAKAPSDSSSDGNPVCVKDVHNLKAGSPSVTELTSTAFTEITITPAKEISDLRITAEEMNYPDSGMGMPEDGEILEYIKTTLYYTTSSSLENVSYTAKIPKEWLDNNNRSLPAVWYYNESAGVWNKAEILSAEAEDGYTFVVFEAEMPGFGWFAVGGIPAELILGNETLPLGPGPVIPSEIPAETVKPESTQTAEPTAAPAATATPLPAVTIISGVFLAAGLLMYRKKH